MSDQTDANFFSTFFNTAPTEETIPSTIQICAKYDDFYNLTHPNRGIALIFNHENYDDRSMKAREGTARDCDRLNRILTKLQFEVRIYNDLKFGEIYDVLKKVSKENHAHSDCLLICIMSHGEEGKIHARDHAFPPDILWEQFTGDHCQTLAGKPKLIFIQACRGSMVDEGAIVKDKHQTDAAPYVEETYSIPAMADILVMYSTYQGYFSWRSPTSGSWFIQSICQELEERGQKTDLLTLLTLANKRVAVGYTSHVPGTPEMHKKKQVCTIVSMLTRLMAFPIKPAAALYSTIDNNEQI